MEILKLNSITDFFTANEALLLKNESFNNLMLGLAISLRDQKFTPQNPAFYSIQSNNDKIACALISDINKPLMLSSMLSSYHASANLRNTHLSIQRT